MKWNFAEILNRYYDNELDRIKAVQKSIKHPHFYYALYDIETGEVQYKRKKWYKWFSGKRMVAIKVPKIKVEGVADYATISSDNGKQRR